MNQTEPILNHYLDSTSRILRVVIPGDLLSTNADALREELFELLDDTAGQPAAWDTFFLDLNAAQMVDSVGLNLVVALLRALRARGNHFRVSVQNPNVHRSFLFTRLDRQLELVRG